MSFRIRVWMAPRGRLGGLVRCLLLVFFLWLVGRYWHPYYGFTKLLQFDASAKTELLPVLRGTPIYFDRDPGGYDGQYYAQLATSPALQDPHLPAAIDNLSYRARRMLLSWIAWLGGGGEPVAAVHVYAWLNPVLWFVLAALLWRIFPTGDWRTTVAWAGLLFSAGILHSVRFALTDLAALALLAAALWQLERGREKIGVLWLGLAALARETSVLGAAVLLPRSGEGRRRWMRAGAQALLIILPLAGWLFYLQLTVGSPEAGQRNFSWPAMGFLGKWREAWLDLWQESNHWLAVSSLLAHLALTVQLLFFALRRQWHDRWWRLGATYAGLLLCLGPAVWEGAMGAAPRVLLPLALAFNVLGVRARAGVFWLILGNLTVLNGLLPIWSVPANPGELATRWSWNQSQLLETDNRWYTTEWNHRSRWAWCSQTGGLTLRSWPRQDRMKVQLHLQGFTARDLAISHAGKIVWRGQLESRLQWIPLPELPAENGKLVLELHSNAPAHGGGPQSDGRELGFVCYGFTTD